MAYAYAGTAPAARSRPSARPAAPPLEAAAAAPSVDLVNAAMKLTPAQLAYWQLPPDRRAKIELLRAKIRQGQLVGAGGAPPPPPGSELL